MEPESSIMVMGFDLYKAYLVSHSEEWLFRPVRVTKDTQELFLREVLLERSAVEDLRDSLSGPGFERESGEQRTMVRASPDIRGYEGVFGQPKVRCNEVQLVVP